MLALVEVLLSYQGRLARYTFSSSENHTFAVFMVHRTQYLHFQIDIGFEQPRHVQLPAQLNRALRQLHLLENELITLLLTFGTGPWPFLSTPREQNTLPCVSLSSLLILGFLP